MFTGGARLDLLRSSRCNIVFRGGGEVRSLVKFKMQHSDQRGWRDFDLL